jgi:hypothetical protein
LAFETDAQKGAGDDVSKQRPEIGDHDAPEMAPQNGLSACELGRVGFGRLSGGRTRARTWDLLIKGAHPCRRNRQHGRGVGWEKGMPMVSERGGGPTLAAAGWRKFLKRAAVHNGDFLDHLMAAADRLKLTAVRS